MVILHKPTQKCVIETSCGWHTSVFARRRQLTRVIWVPDYFTAGKFDKGLKFLGIQIKTGKFLGSKIWVNFSGVLRLCYI